MPDSIDFYNDGRVAARYERHGGFAPQRKERMLGVVLDLLLALTPPGAELLELGAGTGHFTEKLLETGHFGTVLATDGAAAMLAVAREKLAWACRAGMLEFDTVDLSDEWSPGFDPESFDVVTSTMAAHHAIDKTRLFRQIFQVLRPGGVLVLGDHMAASSDLGNYLIDRARALVALGKASAPEEGRILSLIEKDRQRQAVEGNRCESTPEYVRALTSCNFRDVDCLWQDYWLAVIIARKPERPPTG